jgi:Fic family protein
MIHRPPNLTDADHRVLGEIVEQRERLRLHTATNPRKWTGSLRRSTFARAIRGSNGIEGYHVTVDDALDVVEGEGLDERTEASLAVKGYRDAMTWVMQTAADPYFEWSRQLLKSMHFMMLAHDMTKSPGQWRSGAIFVVDAGTGEAVHHGPDVERIDPLMTELVRELATPGSDPVEVRAALAHLNLAMIHPFKDGNGRMARALQTLVLARGGLLHPIFSSIEEWLGENTDEYYAVLAAVGRGAWNPTADTGPWVRFCLKAHHQQAATLLRRDEEYERLFAGILAIATREKLPERAHLPLFDAALGFRVTNARYRGDASVSEFVASRDLKRLVDAGLLVPKGEKRGRVYGRGEELTRLREATRSRRPVADPYAERGG